MLHCLFGIIKQPSFSRWDFKYLLQKTSSDWSILFQKNRLNDSRCSSYLCASFLSEERIVLCVTVVPTVWLFSNDCYLHLTFIIINQLYWQDCSRPLLWLYSSKVFFFSFYNVPEKFRKFFHPHSDCVKSSQSKSMSFYTLEINKILKTEAFVCLFPLFLLHKISS